MLKQYFFILSQFVLVTEQSVAAQNHPCGLVTATELTAIRLQVKQPRYKDLLQQFEQQQSTSLPAAISNGDEAYQVEKELTRQAFLYALSSREVYSTRASMLARMIVNDPVVYNNPLVKGLTRAAVLRSLTTAYDLCYNSWPQSLRDTIASSLLQTAFSMKSTMGFEANYALESNWMGVRYGSILYALMVTDDKGRRQGRFQEADMLEWDTRERLRDHISANMNPNGWSGESLGYHYYSWSFIGPALMAYEHKALGPRKAVDMLAPSCRNAVAAHASALAFIDGGNGYKAVKPDFSDDNIGVLPEFFLQALRLYPPSQVPYIRWLVEAMGKPQTAEALFYAVAWMPDTVASRNPAEAGWRNAVEEAQGMLTFRNTFRNGQDIVAAFTTTAKRIRAHQSGDNLTFRIMGFDNIWVVGGGRTGLKAGQPTLFPTDTVSLTESYKGGAIGQLLRYNFDGAGGGHAMGNGSCMGVESHQRFFRADFDPLTGAGAAFMVYDRSLNGRTWRLTTPEWNKVTVTRTGFVLTAPNNATMQVTVLRSGRPLQVRTSGVKYNGTTTNNASGIPLKGKHYGNITAVDVAIDKSALIVMTLQPPRRKAPVVKVGNEDNFMVGKKEYSLREME